MPVRRNPLADALFYQRFNENHDPDNGQFTDGGGGGSSGGGTSVGSSVGSKETKQGVEKAGKTGSGSGSGGGKGGGKGPGSAGAGDGANGRVPRSYEGRSPSASSGSGRLEGATIERVFAPNAEHDSALEARGISSLTFNELKHDEGGAKVFHTLIAEAKKSNQFGAAVTLYPEEDYQHTRLFITDDGKVGFALKGNDIISVFKHEDAPRGAVASILPLAVQAGGRRLDCFDTQLPFLYSKSGFAATGRVKFNDEFAPDGWDKETYKKYNGGSPDIVFMKYDPANAGYKPGDGKLFDSYDDAAADQVASVEADEKKDGARGAFFYGHPADLLSRYNENHDPDNGQFTDGDGGGGGGGGSSGGSGSGSSSGSKASSKSGSKSSSKSSSPAPAASATTTTTASSGSSGDKKKSKLDDFAKAKVTLGDFTADKRRVDRFIEQWDARVGTDPEDFKKQFMGGTDASMTIRVGSDGKWTIDGSILNKEGRSIGTYTRTIDWATKTAESAYFQINGGQTNKNIGKAVLAGNIEQYKKMGIEKVRVHANIDVGGYAWAKYGYVPDRSSWSDLSAEIRGKLGGESSGGGSGYRPESWDEISEYEQENIRDAWMRSTRDEFVESEVQNWRDNGDALDQSKGDLAEQYDVDDLRPEWAVDAVSDVIADRADGEHPIPYTQQQILAAVSVSYETGYEGRPDPEIEFDNDKLQEPSTFSKDQLLLPGIEKIDPSAALSVEMRDEIEKALQEAFNKKAQSDSEELDPPDYIHENVEEYQRESWDSMSDREKYRWADNNGSIEMIESDDDDQGNLDIDADDADGLLALADSDDPKALWAIADSDQGKDLLLGSDWYGTLNLKDKETMDRFNAYVGKSGATSAQV